MILSEVDEGEKAQMVYLRKQIEKRMESLYTLLFPVLKFWVRVCKRNTVFALQLGESVRPSCRFRIVWVCGKKPKLPRKVWENYAVAMRCARGNLMPLIWDLLL